MRISIKAARTNVGLTQKEAAKELHVTQKTLSFWENGKTKPTISMVAAICALYRVSYDDIEWSR